ncbi:ATP-binding protein [soil metagenome]
MLLKRALRATIERMAQSFPVIVVTGARQSGKTTLVRTMFADRAYVSMEDPAERAFALEDPRGFLARFLKGAIFDEAQRWPELFSFLQGLVDEDRTPGRFILTGSQQFDLLAGISQSLAGRAGMTRLLPLSLAENPARKRGALDEWILSGGYPALCGMARDAGDWFASYVATYVERDVRQLLNVQNLTTFQRFLRLCAGRAGQLLNLNALAGEAGISHTTARAWMSVLESSDLVYLLPPYHKNFGKRLVKSPKLYFLDTGLACWLQGIRSRETLALHPSRGALFETLVVGEFLKARYNQGLPADLYFWRDNNGLEADLIYETGETLQMVEIKSGQTLTGDYVRAGKKAASVAPTQARMPLLIYGGEDSYERSGVRVIGWKELEALPFASS